MRPSVGNPAKVAGSGATKSRLGSPARTAAARPSGWTLRSGGRTPLMWVHHSCSRACSVSFQEKNYMADSFAADLMAGLLPVQEASPEARFVKIGRAHV